MRSDAPPVALLLLAVRTGRPRATTGTLGLGRSAEANLAFILHRLQPQPLDTLEARGGSPADSTFVDYCQQYGHRT